ncbi:MAG: hypothetical protein ACKKL6_03950 [Candidatus Komeilibacteria bacterium]
MSWLQAGPYFLGTESFYHAKMVESLENSLKLDNFSWLQSTNYSNSFTDSNWLYHIFLSLFVGVLPTFLVIKIFAALFSALLALYVYYWLTKHNGFLPGLFVLLLFSIIPFAISINNLGAISAALFVLLVGLEFVVNYRYWQLGVLSITLTLLTGQFIFLFVIALLWLLIELIYNKYKLDMFREGLSSIKDWVLRKLGLRSKTSRRKWLILIFCLFGIVIGLMVNPYWPESTSFYKELIANKNTNTFSGVYNSFVSLISSAKLLFIIFLSSVFSVVYLNKRIVKLTAFLLLLTFVFVLNTLLFSWGIEFTYLIIILTTSLILRDCFGSLGLWSAWNSHKRNTNLVRAGIVIATIIILFIPLKGYYVLNKDGDFYPLNYMQEAAEWLYYHIPDNALVINTDYEDWAPLFYYNDNNRYWWGLSNNIMNNAQKSSRNDLIGIIDGSSNKNPYALFKGSFKADYLLVNSRRNILNSRLTDNIYFSLVYSDEDCYIYEIQ